MSLKKLVITMQNTICKNQNLNSISTLGKKVQRTLLKLICENIVSFLLTNLSKHQLNVYAIK